MKSCCFQRHFCSKSSIESHSFHSFLLFMFLILLGGCNKPLKETSSQKNFVSIDPSGETRLLPWPYYTAEESAAAAKVVGAVIHSAEPPKINSLFALSKLGKDPKLCFYGKKMPKDTAREDPSHIYMNPDPSLSTMHPISCDRLIGKMKKNNELKMLAQKIENQAKDLGIERCTYLTLSLSPPISAFLQKLKGVVK